MPTHSHHTARLLWAAALLAAGAAAVFLLSPGGLGDPGPVEVGHGASASAYRALTGAVADAPVALLEAASEGTVAVLGLLLAVLGWTALRRKDARGIAGTAVVGLGTVAAYALSEALKLVVDEERPCRAVRGATAIAHCPAAGDWSFPSNHATLAAALAIGLAVLRPRWSALTLPTAAAAALLRVLVGAHYPHDVLAGAILGGCVVAAALLVLEPLAVRLTSAALRRRRYDTGLVRHDGGRGPVVHPQPGQDGADVRLDRPLDHMEAARDLSVRQPAAEEGQHLALPGGERRDPLPGRAAPPGQGTGAARREMRDHSGGDLR